MRVLTVTVDAAGVINGVRTTRPLSLATAVRRASAAISLVLTERVRGRHNLIVPADEYPNHHDAFGVIGQHYKQVRTVVELPLQLDSS